MVDSLKLWRWGWIPTIPKITFVDPIRAPHTFVHYKRICYNLGWHIRIRGARTMRRTPKLMKGRRGKDEGLHVYPIHDSRLSQHFDLQLSRPYNTMILPTWRVYWLDLIIQWSCPLGEHIPVMLGAALHPLCLLCGYLSSGSDLFYTI